MKLNRSELHEHPLNSNEMTEATLIKLEANIKMTGKYPPIIVRSLGKNHGHQILDGHQRLKVLTRLGINEIECDVWDVTETQGNAIIATVNTLHGEENKEKRGALLRALASAVPISDLKKLLPDTGRSLVKVLELNDSSSAAGLPSSTSTDKAEVVKFVVFGSQKKVIDQAIQEMQRKILQDGAPSCAEGTALEYICAEFLSGVALA